jgi:hypothetical protein
VAERLALAALAREAAAAARMSGSTTTSVARFIDPNDPLDGFVAEVTRDRFGRRRVDWSRANTQPDE